MLLIIGSNGLLGRHSAAYFGEAGWRVLCASHRPGADIHLDLQAPVETSLDRRLAKVTHALVCSSVTSIDQCYRDPQGTRRFNVLRTVELLQTLLKRGIFPIYCSSDAVFKGDRGDYAEDESRGPTTEYGLQKKAVEDFLLGQDRPSLIIRMSKLYSLDPDDPSPVGQMLDAFERKTVVRCAVDQVICPTWVSDIPRAIASLLLCHAAGIYHVAARELYSRYSLGIFLAKSIQGEHLVQSCSIRDLALSEARPSNNSLNVNKLLSQTGFKATTLEENLPNILQKRRAITSRNATAKTRNG
jgi:dTDP-4-dehydrorhamnose reductase